MNKNSLNDAVSHEKALCLVERQFAIQAYMKVAVLFRCQEAGIIQIETHCNIIGLRCFMTERGLMHILPGKPFYLYITNLKAKQTNLPNDLIVPSASNAPTCIIHAQDDEPQMLKDKGRVMMQCDKSSTDPTVKEVRYKPFQRRKKQVNRHNAAKISDKILKIDWRGELMIPEEYSTYCNKFIRMLTQFKSTWDSISVRLKWCSTAWKWRRWITDQSLYHHNEQGPRRESWKSKR